MALNTNLLSMNYITFQERVVSYLSRNTPNLVFFLVVTPTNVAGTLLLVRSTISWNIASNDLDLVKW